MLRRDFLTAAAALPALGQTTGSSTAERLGYSTSDKLLMVHADDVGMCHSVNVATIEALKHGMVVSGSIMMPCPWVSEIAEYARANPEADLGLHLTLTSEWRHYRWRPVARPDLVKGLLDPDGYLFRDVRGVALRAAPEEVETELRAQIERARHFGIKFTHLDTHMGTLYARREYFEIYTKLAREYRVPCMLPRPRPELAISMAGYPITAEMLAGKEKQGHVLLDYLHTGVPGRTVAERLASYGAFLKNLKPGVSKLIVHLSMDDPEIRAVTGNWEQRWTDFRFFTGPATKKQMADLGIRTITYRELGKLLK